MLRKRTIVFVGGGSGGHLFPALAVIEHLLSDDPLLRVMVLCSQRQIDRQILSAASVHLRGLEWEPVFPVPRGGWLRRQLTAPLKLMQGRSRALQWLQGLRPELVVGLGAFASVPGILAASALRIPIVLFEWNTVPGMATRMLASRAARIFTGLPLQPEWYQKWSATVEQTGVPIRSDFRAAAAAALEHVGDRRLLLILGGSQGASRLNRIVRAAFEANTLADGPLHRDGWAIVHQTGEHDLAELSRFYVERDLPAAAAPFLPNLPALLLRAGLVISRAGAATLAEIASAATPSILMPLSSAANDHQQRNADIFLQAGASCVLSESSASAATSLATRIQEFCSSEEKRQQMAQAVRSFARPDASRVLANRLYQLLE